MCLKRRSVIPPSAITGTFDSLAKAAALILGIGFQSGWLRVAQIGDRKITGTPARPALRISRRL